MRKGIRDYGRIWIGLFRYGRYGSSGYRPPASEAVAPPRADLALRALQVPAGSALLFQRAWTNIATGTNPGVFPTNRIDEIRRQEGRKLRRFDVDFDLPASRRNSRRRFS
jgi:hypothetical protein